MHIKYAQLAVGTDTTQYLLIVAIIVWLNCLCLLESWTLSFANNESILELLIN